MLCASVGKAEISFGAGPHAGVSFSSLPDPSGKYFGTGFLFGAHGDVNIAPFLTTRLSLDYSIFSSDKEKIKNDLAAQFGGVASDYTAEGLNVSMFSVYVDGKGKIQTGSSITPYGLFGLGLNFVSVSESKAVRTADGASLTNPSTSSTDFGLNFGAGTEFSAGSVILYIEFKYALILSSPSGSHFPIVLGATFPF